MRTIKTMRMILCSMMIALLTGCGGGGGGGSSSDGGTTTIDPNTITPSSITTFSAAGGSICREDGKPVIRMFSTSTCPHCEWAAGAFDPVVKMYAEEGLIVARHWNLDTGDDLLTPQVETSIPASELAVYNANQYSFLNYVPAYVFGCKYFRLGNGFEGSNNLRAEAAEYMAVIEALLDAEDDGNDGPIDPETITPSSITTFSAAGGEICREDDKPVIRMFSTSTCPHCQWAAGAFDPVVEMYAEEGVIVAHHWDIDTGDDLMTPEVETSVPDSEMAIYNDNQYGFQNYVPAYVFGCDYYRLGNGFEGTDDLAAEAAEHMAVIEALLNAE